VIFVLCVSSFLLDGNAGELQWRRYKKMVVGAGVFEGEFISQNCCLKI